MKKICFQKILIWFWVIFDCLILPAQFISLQDAITRGKDFITNKTGIKSTKETEIEVFKENDTTFFYNVYQPDAGSVLLSAYEHVGPYLIYIPHHRLFFDTENKSFQFWLSYYKDIIRYVLNHQSDSFRQNIIPIKDTKQNNYFFLIQTQWDQYNRSSHICTYNKYVQDDGKGSFCPCGKCYAGCVAIAMAQIMRYWAHPVFYNNLSISIINWCNMPVKISPDSPLHKINEVAYFIADVGKKVNMHYCSDSCSSGAYVTDAKNAFIQYNYSHVQLIEKKHFTRKKWKQKIHHELNNDRPVFYAGCSSNGCHAFICDGYDNDDPDFFHFNLGWGGQNDGFYYMFDEPPIILFNYKQQAIINIIPDEMFDCNKIQYISELDRILFPSRYFTPLMGIIATVPVPPFVNINSGENVVYRATEIILNDGFIADEGSYFVAETFSCPENCSHFNLSPQTLKVEVSQDSVSPFLQPVTIYPNPTENEIFIKFNSDYNSHYSISIIDLAGRVLKKFNFVDDFEILPISVIDLNSGMYFLLLETNQEKFTVKFIKK